MKSRSNGYLEGWSGQHMPDPVYGWDSALTPHLLAIREAGFETKESCQGGWKAVGARRTKGSYPYLTLCGPRTRTKRLGSRQVVELGIDPRLNRLERRLIREGFDVKRSEWQSETNDLRISWLGSVPDDADAQIWWHDLTALITDCPK